LDVQFNPEAAGGRLSRLDKQRIMHSILHGRVYYIFQRRLDSRTFWTYREAIGRMARPLELPRDQQA
jgi:hypothetical protein